MNSRWCVFISGTGSNLRALLDMRSHFQISCVVSQKPNAVGIKHAQNFGVPYLVLPAQINWKQLTSDLKKFGITHIFLAGFMKILPADFVSDWEGRIFNIHPSLLPLYPGLKSIERAFEEKATLGVTIHQVTQGVDEGPREYQISSARYEDIESSELYVHVSEHALVRKFGFEFNLRKISGL